MGRGRVDVGWGESEEQRHASGNFQNLEIMEKIPTALVYQDMAKSYITIFAHGAGCFLVIYSTDSSILNYSTFLNSEMPISFLYPTIPIGILCTSLRRTNLRETKSPTNPIGILGDWFEHFTAVK